MIKTSFHYMIIIMTMKWLYEDFKPLRKMDLSIFQSLGKFSKYVLL
jgi:hypothetical protein